jgi:large subunit ribosomal protein L17
MANGYRKLGRTSAQRKALLRDLVTDLIINERITTTEMKAKELTRLADKMVTLGKKGTLAARRQAAQTIRPETADDQSGQTALQKLFDDLAPRFSERPGGYTRVLKVGPRRGDGAEMAIIEFVE